MVGLHEIVIYGLGNSHYSYVVSYLLCKGRYLGYGIHRIVSTYVEEILYIVLGKYSEYLLVYHDVGIRRRVGVRKLHSTGSESRRRCTLKHSELIGIAKRLIQIDYPSFKESLDSVSHSVYRTYVLAGDSALDNSCKRCIDSSGRTARLSNYSVSVKFLHFSLRGITIFLIFSHLAA